MRFPRQEGRDFSRGSTGEKLTDPIFARIELGLAASHGRFHISEKGIKICCGIGNIYILAIKDRIDAIIVDYSFMTDNKILLTSYAIVGIF